MNLGNLFSATGLVIETAVIGLLIYRKVWHKLPAFSLYCVWALMSDAAAFAIKLTSSGGYGIKFYVAITVADFALQLCVLVELAWSVLQPLRQHLSRKALPVVAGAILALGAATWPFAGLTGVPLPTKAWQFVFQLEQTASILRVVFFLVLAGGSQLLSLGWRDRELQVATGFGFYSLVSLAVATLNTHQATALQVRNLYYLVAFSFVGSLMYWVVSFAQKEAERREFTPQMQSTLLTLAEAVHLTRAALKDLSAAEPQGENRC